MKAGLYARVSTHDQHTLQMQIEALQSYADQRGWEIVPSNHGGFGVTVNKLYFTPN